MKFPQVGIIIDNPKDRFLWNTMMRRNMPEGALVVVHRYSDDCYEVEDIANLHQSHFWLIHKEDVQLIGEL
jgi:hypothetical protein